MDAFAIPGPWHALILILGAYRLVRFVGWDEWPPVARLRAWLIGERWISVVVDEVRDLYAQGDTLEAQRRQLSAIEAGEWPGAHTVDGPELPGKQPSSEAEGVRPAYDRPMLAHLIHCPYCIGFWTSLAVYAAWLTAPLPTLYAMTPFAISGAVGLLAKNLDA